LLRLARRNKDAVLLKACQTNMKTYYQQQQEGFDLPKKFEKMMTTVSHALNVD